ncbi:MAG TPA: maleylpyruvate isomerase family mycothiol-dependent enzyme [Acidimicrobiia bacterium]
MKITPRYDADPIVRLDGPPPAIREPFLRQRRRLAKVLTHLSAAQWSTGSRCAGWRVQDVVAHLAGTNRFWNAAITGGVAGTPTRFLAGFDPVATPAALVDAVRDASPADTLASYVEGNDALCATVESLDDDGWNAIGEAPVGHVAVSVLTHHALWDAWVHERDILQPLGLVQDEEDDEIVASVRYAAALSPAFAVQSSTGRRGTLALELTRPDMHAVVTVDGDVRVSEGDAPAGALVVRGAAVDVLEALSVRAPWPEPIADDQAWLLGGLAEAFDSAPS